jgi:glycosyltransferase involved in cell wall biosynthesis
MTRAATLSLCMIVRDEEELLPQFITSVRGLWDDFCVVDTGSRDGTAALLRAAGARVIERPWTGHFADARNAGLAEARGDFIVYLDADELPGPDLVREVREVLADPQLGAATIQMRNQLPHGHHTQTGLLRLFRNHPSIRFRGRIHEEISTDVSAFLKDQGLVLRHLRAPALHTGYVRERALERDKKTRDVDLLTRAVAEDPGDFYSRYKLLELARFWSDDQLARTQAAECLQALERVYPDGLAHQRWGGGLLALVASAAFADEPAEGLALLDRWEPHLRASAAFFLRQGELAELAGERERAASSFARCLELADDTTDVQLATVRPLMALARLAMTLPNGLEHAWNFVERALTFNHRDPEALLGAAVICRTAGGDRLLAELERDYVGRYGETDELRAALAWTPGTSPSPA